MTGYQETLARHRRAVILRILATAPGYAANETLLREVLAGQGLPTARAQIRGDITWLAEQGFLLTERIADIIIARITADGEDVAAGRAHHPDVQRPEP
jgi:hypothetical protein